MDKYLLPSAGCIVLPSGERIICPTQEVTSDRPDVIAHLNGMVAVGNARRIATLQPEVVATAPIAPTKKLGATVGLK